MPPRGAARRPSAPCGGWWRPKGSPAAYAEAVKTLRILGDPQGAAALLRHALTVHPGSKELKALADRDKIREEPARGPCSGEWRTLF